MNAKTLTDLQAELFEANTAQDLDRAKVIAEQIRKHPEYKAQRRQPRYVIATRRNQSWK